MKVHNFGNDYAQLYKCEHEVKETKTDVDDKIDNGTEGVAEPAGERDAEETVSGEQKSEVPSAKETKKKGRKAKTSQDDI